jgi:hypothetical protein
MQKTRSNEISSPPTKFTPDTIIITKGMEAPDLATVKDLFALHRYELRQDYNETYGRFD